jgi:GAF domain-containing protein
MLAAAARFASDRLRIAVVVVVGFAMLLVAGSAIDSAARLGSFGIATDDAGKVVAVDARVLGIKVGDRILLPKLDPAQRFSFENGVREGTKLDLVIDGAPYPHTVLVEAVRSDDSELARVTRFVGIAAGFVGVIGLATLVFLASPRPATLGFYLYAFVMLVKTYQTTLVAVPWPLDFVGDMFVQVCYPLAQFLILLFAVQIFERYDRVTRALLRIDAALGIATFSAWAVTIAQSTFLCRGLPGDPIWWTASTDFVQILVTLVGLGYVAQHAAGSRTRVRLVIVGIALPALNDFVWAATSLIDKAASGNIPYLAHVAGWTDVLAPWFGPVGIGLVCYGLVLRKIVGFRSAVAQAAVATLATISLLALFTLIDSSLEKITGESDDRVKVATLLITGFVLRLTHHRLDEFVKDVLFKRRVENAKELRAVAHALACTASRETIEELLLGEPLRILRLPAAAFFVAPADDEPFALVAQRGASAGTWPHAIVDQGILAARLRADRRPLPIDPAHDGDLFTCSGARGAVAIPLFLRGALGGVAIYAQRTDDAPLDADERALLERLAEAAAAAFDHVDAREARSQARAEHPARPGSLGEPRRIPQHTGP